MAISYEAQAGVPRDLDDIYCDYCGFHILFLKHFTINVSLILYVCIQLGPILRRTFLRYVRLIWHQRS